MSRRHRDSHARRHRLPLPTCRTCPATLTRAAKNTGEVICPRCEQRIEAANEPITLRIKA